MASKVFEITFTIAAENPFTSNSVKANIVKLLNMGRSAKVVNSKLTPLLPTNSIACYLSKKTKIRFFKGEFLILTKEEKFPDDTAVNALNLQKKLEDVIPMLNDKKSGQPLNLEVIEIKAKKL